MVCHKALGDWISVAYTIFLRFPKGKNLLKYDWAIVVAKKLDHVFLSSVWETSHQDSRMQYD
jgi:hypothetical protein